MKKLLLLLAVATGAALACAQPTSFVDLGSIPDTSSIYEVPDRSFGVDVGPSEVKWFKFTLPHATTGVGAFFDIDVFATGSTNQLDTEIGLYDATGNRIANDDDDGHSLRSALSFGDAGPRTQPADPFGFTNGLAHNGRDGDLAIGTYWFSISQFNTIFGDTDWDVTAGGTRTNTAQVNFRTSAVPEPATLAALGIGAVALLRRRKK